MLSHHRVVSLCVAFAAAAFAQVGSITEYAVPTFALARLCGFWLTLGKAGCSHFRALPEGVRRAGRRYRVGASVTSLATYRTNTMRPVSSSQ